MIVAVLLVTASAGGPIAGRGTFTVFDVQYSPQPAYGPSVYYGSPVRLDYMLTLHWSSITYPNDDVRQTLTASGTVNIYDVTDPENPIFIETRSCSVSINFYDNGGDACSGFPGGFYSWGPPYEWEKMERFYHLHQVSGVYTRLAWVRNGIGWGKVTVFTQPPTILIVSE
ncbi:MAG: hypothetical protein ACFFCQ_10585 [Promethearchaeota archaeon]